MLRKKSSMPRSFFDVALFIILSGAAVLAIGMAFWCLNYFQGYHFVSPSTKIEAGLIILSLGYIVLDLELLRESK